MGRAFEKRKSTIFARMDRVGKQFAKIGKDITIAVKSGGTSPDANPALRRVLQNARAINMPKDKVEAAIKKASGQGATTYDVIVYEGYAAHGIALLVEAATDNVTRTVANVRHAFKAHGGNMGTTGSVAFMFQRQGVFRLDPTGIDRDTLRFQIPSRGSHDYLLTRGSFGTAALRELPKWLRRAGGSLGAVTSLIQQAAT